MRNNVIVLFLSVIVSPVFAQSIVGTWDCTNGAGLHTSVTLNADNTLNAGTALGSFSGHFALRGNSLVYFLSGSPNPAENVITRRDENSFDSHPVNNPTQRETCRRVSASCAPEGRCLTGNCVNGTGTLVTTDGYKYDGEFRNCRLHGRGILAGPAFRYDGEWQDQKPSGYGVYTWASGSRYEGQWKKGKKSGHGIKTDADRSRYEGEWEDDEFSGHGIFTGADGARTEGVWNAGVFPESVIHTTPDGTRYEGKINDGKFNGRGILTNVNRGIRYEGEFLNWEMHGFGILIVKDRLRYEGNFEKGNFSGQGTCIWKDGRKYVGMWKDGKRHGHGMQYKSDGSIEAQGEFVNDAPPT